MRRGGVVLCPRDVSAKSPLVAATSRRLILSATGETSPRRLRDLLETKDLEETLRRRLRDTAWPTLETAGDVAETSPQLRRRPRDFRANWLSPGLETSPRCLRDVALVRVQAISWSPESRELPRLISRGQSRRRLRQWDRPFSDENLFLCCFCLLQSNDKKIIIIMEYYRGISGCLFYYTSV